MVKHGGIIMEEFFKFIDKHFSKIMLIGALMLLAGCLTAAIIIKKILTHFGIL